MPEDRAAQDRETEGEGAHPEDEIHGPEHVVHAAIIVREIGSSPDSLGMVSCWSRTRLRVRPQPEAAAAVSVFCLGRPVPNAPHRLDQMLVLGAELRAQAAHMHVDGSRAAVEVVAPDLAQERRSRETNR